MGRRFPPLNSTATSSVRGQLWIVQPGIGHDPRCRDRYSHGHLHPHRRDRLHRCNNVCTVDRCSGDSSDQLAHARQTIVYGTALSGAQLNASAYQTNGTTPLPGVFVYNPAAGTELSIGSQELSVTFTPTDTSDFTSVTKTVSLTVTQSTLTVSSQ